MRKLLSLALVALLVAVSGVAGEKKDPKDMRIGYVMTDRNNVFQNMIADALKARADQYGVQLVILDGENRAEMTVSLAPITKTTSVLAKSSLISSISKTMS